MDELNNILDSLYQIYNNPKEGVGNSRMHFNRNGKPKIRYTSKESANKAATSLLNQGDWQTPYFCKCCQGYHTGHCNSLNYYQLGKCILAAVELVCTLYRK